MDAHATIVEYASLTRRRLPRTILPYWRTVSRDDEAGGFLLPDDVLRNPVRRVGRALVRARQARPRPDKQLVTQARLVWSFAHAHRKGYDEDGRCLDAAGRGRKFLLEHFLDAERGGYRWITDRVGRPVNDVKLLYGQAFVVYALVELARASRDPEPLADALALFRVVEHELHDDDHGGWREQAGADWGPLADDDPRVEIPFNGRKSANAVLHWLEATAELYADTGDEQVRRSLVEALDLGRTVLFPDDPTTVREPFLRDWTPDPTAEHLVSYGHNLEFAWLMLRAQEVLGEPGDWARFHAYVDDTLRFGFDHGRGGGFTAGRPGRPAHRRHKVWWVQCELMVALSVALAAQPDERHAAALARTVTFVERYLTDRRDGVLLDSVQEDGRRRWPRKSGNWKAGYHDVRAAVRLAETFAPPPASGS